MDGKVVKISIDHREYLFKLGTDEEIDRLKQLVDQLEKRIQTNKRSIATNDYTKVLMLTCLDLMEEINQSQSESSSVSASDSEVLQKLNEIVTLFKHNS